MSFLASAFLVQDPREALKELEIKVGSNPGELLREMEQLSPPGDDWGNTLHPTSLEAEEFANKATRMHARTRTGWMSHAIAAGLAIAVIVAGVFGVRSLLIGRRIEQLQFGALTISTDADTFAAMTRDGATFPAGRPVYLMTEVRNAPSHIPVSVVWVGPDNRELRKEINWTQAGEQALSFTAPATVTWKTGEYRAEVWVANRKVGQAQFDITPTESTKTQ